MPSPIPRAEEHIGLPRECQKSFFIFDTHPIQYRSPVFVALYKKLPGLHVYFFNDSFNGNRWWFQEVGKIPSQRWDLSLRDGFPSEVLGTAKGSFFQTYKKLLYLLSEKRPAGVAIYGYYLPEHWMLRWLCAKMNIPLIFIGETFSFKGSPLRKLFKSLWYPFFFSAVNGIIAIGERSFQYYRSHAKEGTLLVPAKYCTDTHYFSPNHGSLAARQRVRQSLAIPPNAFVSLFVGRLFDRKRPQDMIEIHKRMSDYPLAYTVIVGNGPLENELHLKSKGIPRLILAGFKSQPEVRDIYHAADLLIVPSVYETWGLVVNEAFASGRTALVTDTCGVAGDLVKEGETGYVYSVGDIESASKLVLNLITDREELLRLSSNAVRTVNDQFHIEQFAAAFAHTFIKLDSQVLGNTRV